MTDDSVARYIEIEEVDPRSEAALACLGAYYAELAARFDDGFDVARSADPDVDDLVAPRGAFLIARLSGKAIGCVGLKGTDKGYAEVKRLWIAPSARGLGLARLLMASIEDRARQLGIARLRLDTNRALVEAITFYRKTGWVEIERFNDDPYPDYYFFEKIL